MKRAQAQRGREKHKLFFWLYCAVIRYLLPAQSLAASSHWAPFSYGCVGMLLLSVGGTHSIWTPAVAVKKTVSIFSFREIFLVWDAQGPSCFPCKENWNGYTQTNTAPSESFQISFHFSSAFLVKLLHVLFIFLCKLHHLYHVCFDSSPDGFWFGPTFGWLDYCSNWGVYQTAWLAPDCQSSPQPHLKSAWACFCSRVTNTIFVSSQLICVEEWGDARLLWLCKVLPHVTGTTEYFVKYTICFHPHISIIK